MRAFEGEIVFALAGEAGQGIQTIEGLITPLLVRGGYHVFAVKEYMSRVRGGINSTTIRVAEQRRMAFREKIDLLIPLHEGAITHLGTRLSKDTLILGEKSRISNVTFDVPLNKSAKELGNPVLTNIIATGLLAELFGLKEEDCLAYISRQFAKKGKEIVAQNIEAAKKGYELGRNLKGEIVISVKRDKRVTEEIIVNGAQAVSLGAIAGGLNYLCAYPMSPSTAVLTQIAAYAEKASIVVEQVEDEIGVVNMAIGAWYAGARAMVTTSGGGFALMTEGISLAGMIESPLVVHLAQRPGPATGMPTRTEQGDLNLVLFAGHGSFPRVVLAPKDLDEAFYLTRLAFNLADRYQVPVFILTDQYLIDCYYNTPAWTLAEGTIENFIIETGEDYQRFAITSSGISPRGIPGFGKGIVCVDSDEHDESGYITENHDIRVKMVEKRLRKGEVVAENTLPPHFAGNSSYSALVVGWGSTYGVIKEVVERIGREDLAHLHFSWVYPLPRETTSYLKRAKKVIVIEGNATGQLASLLQSFIDYPLQKILKFNGLSFSVEELTEQVVRRL